MSEFNVFKLNDIITTHDDTPVITGLTQIYLSQVTILTLRATGGVFKSAAFSAGIDSEVKRNVRSLLAI